MSNLVFDESSSNREASHGYAWWFSGDTFEKAMAEDRKPRKRGLTRRLVNHPGRLTIFYFLTLAVLSTTRSSPQYPPFPHAASPSSTPPRIGPPSAKACSSSPYRWVALAS